MAASVTDARQAVVFGANPDVQRTRSDASAKRRGKVANTLFHREAGVSQRLTEPGRGLLFLKAQLGMGMDAAAETDQTVAGGLKTFSRCGFCVHSHFPAEAAHASSA